MHGFTNQMVGHISRTKEIKYYHLCFKQIAKNLTVPLLILEYSDLNGSDLGKNHPVYFASLIQAVTDMLVIELETF